MTDIITVEGIKAGLCFDGTVEAYEAVDSTNTVAAERLISGCGEWHTVVASAQSTGEGRLGRSFYSPMDTGIYMSCVLYPDERMLPLVTGMAAVAVCRAIERVCGEKPGIKWVNDIILDGKKVCGILAKSRTVGKKRGVILGIGINVYPPREGFPNDITHTAGYLAENQREGLKNQMISAVLNELYRIYDSGESAVCEYRRRCITVGRRVSVIPAGNPAGGRDATALSVDDSYGLLVRLDDGSEETVSSGEVSVRFENY